MITSYLTDNKFYSKFSKFVPTNDEYYIYIDLTRPHCLMIFPYGANYYSQYTALIFLFPATVDGVQYKIIIDGSYNKYGNLYSNSSVYIGNQMGQLFLSGGTLLYQSSTQSTNIYEV